MNLKQNNDAHIFVAKIKPSTTAAELMERFKASDVILYGLNNESKNEGVAKVIWKNKHEAMEFLSGNVKLLKKKKYDIF